MAGIRPTVHETASRVSGQFAGADHPAEKQRPSDPDQQVVKCWRPIACLVCIGRAIAVETVGGLIGAG